jgi:hypothetical protein
MISDKNSSGTQIDLKAMNEAETVSPNCGIIADKDVGLH